MIDIGETPFNDDVLVSEVVLGNDISLSSIVDIREAPYALLPPLNEHTKDNFWTI